MISFQIIHILKCFLLLYSLSGSNCMVTDFRFAHYKNNLHMGQSEFNDSLLRWKTQCLGLSIGFAYEMDIKIARNEQQCGAENVL